VVTARRAAGFTLVELLVAAAVTLAALGLAVLLLLPSAAAFHALPEAVDAQQRLRVAVQTLADSIRGAGASPVLESATRGAPAWPAVLPCRLAGGPLAAVPGGCAGSEAITTLTVALGAPQAALAEALTDPAGPLRLAPLSACALSAPPCRVRAGSQVLVEDGTGAWDILTVSAVSADGALVEHAGSSLSRPYKAGATVAEVEAAAYSLRVEAATNVPVLRRATGPSSDLPVVDHVAALRLEYFGVAGAPLVLDDADANLRRTTYGPLPPQAGLDDPLDAWAAGENCLFSRAGGEPVARVASLPAERLGLARLPPALFADGPWCPDAGAPNRYDADLLRVRLVRVVLRIEAQSSSVRGLSSQLFSRPGTSRESARLVPDLEAHVDVAIRNGGR